jgi:hypothetical protein
VTAALRPLGFAKGGATYRREVDGLLWLLDVQRSQWNSKERISFTLNWGVFVPGLFSLYSNRPDAGRPRVSQSCIHGRVGDLMPGGLDHWWDIRADDVVPMADERVADELRQGHVGYVLPFLEAFKERQDVIDYLEHSGVQQVAFDPRAPAIRLAYLGILYCLRGDRDRCCDAITSAEEAAVKSSAGFREHLAALRARLCGS